MCHGRQYSPGYDQTHQTGTDQDQSGVFSQSTYSQQSTRAHKKRPRISDLGAATCAVQQAGAQDLGRRGRMYPPTEANEQETQP
jgi:hypothetical protein